MKILTTMITPYKKDGSIDFDTAEKYVDWYYENGLDGIFAVCQSSEIFYLSLEERIELNRRVYKRAKELDKNFLVALTYFKKSAEQGFAPAQFMWGYYYHNGIATTKNTSKAIELFALSAKQGYAKAINKLKQLKLCTHCGGSFKGFIIKKCSSCGKKKDY